MLGERIKTLRKEKGMTQEAFARLIGIRQNSLALIESGKRNTSEQVILSIIREFGVHEVWLRNGSGPMFPSGSEDDLIALAAKFRAANPAIRAIVRHLIELPPASQTSLIEWITATYGSFPSRDDVNPLTRADLHAELDRQLDAQKETPASQVS